MAYMTNTIRSCSSIEIAFLLKLLILPLALSQFFLPNFCKKYFNSDLNTGEFNSDRIKELSYESISLQFIYI